MIRTVTTLKDDFFRKKAGRKVKIFITAALIAILLIMLFTVKFALTNNKKAPATPVFCSESAKVLPGVDMKCIDYGSVVIYNE